MKKILIIFLVFFMSSKLYSQEEYFNFEWEYFDKLPEPVEKYFPVVYKLPDTVKVRWFVSDSFYIAKFVSNSFPVEVFMKANGFWYKTVWKMPKDNLPYSIISYLNTNYPGYYVDRVELVQYSTENKKYRLTLIPPDGISPPVRVLFDIYGKFLEVEERNKKQ